jgi:hypothetical protein
VQYLHHNRFHDYQETKEKCLIPTICKEAHDFHDFTGSFWVWVLSVQLKLEALSLQEQKKHCQGLFRTPALMIQPPALVHVHDSS